MAQTSLFEKYCLDSSFVLEFWNPGCRYPKDQPPFNEIWEVFEGLANQGVIISPMEVYKELKDDIKPDFAEWIRNHKGIFVQLDHDQLEIVSEIVNKYPAFTEGQKNKSGGDPFVVALAKVKGLTVLTEEKYTKGITTPPKQPKMPNLCEEFGVQHINIADFCAAEIKS